MKNLYCLSSENVSQGQLMMPCQDDGLTKVNHVLELYRPDNKLSRNHSLILFDNPMACITEIKPKNSLYSVSPSAELSLLQNKSDCNWINLLNSKLKNCNQNLINEHELHEISLNYWNGIPSGDVPLWEYRADSAIVIKKEPLSYDQVERKDERVLDKIKIERLRYAMILFKLELAIEKLEMDIASGRSKFSDFVAINNEYQISLIAQKMRIKRAGGCVLDQSYSAEYLKIEGDVPKQAKEIQKTLDKFYPNGCIVKVIPNEDLSKGYELYLWANSSTVHPAILSVKSMLEIDLPISENDFVKMDDKNQIVAGINSKDEALLLINKHINKLKQPSSEMNLSMN